MIIKYEFDLDVEGEDENELAFRNGHRYRRFIEELEEEMRKANKYDSHPVPKDWEEFREFYFKLKAEWLPDVE